MLIDGRHHQTTGLMRAPILLFTELFMEKGPATLSCVDRRILHYDMTRVNAPFMEATVCHIVLPIWKDVCAIVYLVAVHNTVGKKTMFFGVIHTDLCIPCVLLGNQVWLPTGRVSIAKELETGLFFFKSLVGSFHLFLSGNEGFFHLFATRMGPLCSRHCALYGSGSFLWWYENNNEWRYYGWSFLQQHMEYRRRSMMDLLGDAILYRICSAIHTHWFMCY